MSGYNMIVEIYIIAKVSHSENSTREAWKFIAAIVTIVFIWQGGATFKLA